MPPTHYNPSVADHEIADKCIHLAITEKVSRKNVYNPRRKAKCGEATKPITKHSENAKNHYSTFSLLYEHLCERRDGHLNNFIFLL